MTKPLPESEAAGDLMTATLAGGDFRRLEAGLGVLPGVFSTLTGYTGGIGEEPSSYNPKDHTESVQVRFLPQQTSYRRILEEFLKLHDPFREPSGRRFMSTVFYHNSSQLRAAREKKRALSQGDREACTGIYPVDRFFPAEDYQQKSYIKKSRVIYRELRESYADHRDFMRSSVAARINGYMAGFGKTHILKKEKPSER